MLFEIDQSVVNHLQSSAATPADFEGLDYVGLGVAEGSHRVIGQRRTLLNLASIAHLQERTRKVLSRAAGRVSQEGALHHRLRVYGRIAVSSNSVPVSGTIGTQRVITFPLRWFDSSGKVQATTVLGENLVDVKSIWRVGEVGAILTGWGYLPVSLSQAHGGGSTIGQVLRSLSASDRFCLCVVDSDRASPTSDLGGTADSVQEFKDSSTHPLIEVFETAGRDLENALPDAFYRKAYGSHAQHGQLVAVLQTLTQQGEADLRAHIDIERGLTLRQVFNHASGSPEEAFWNTKLPILLACPELAAAALPCLGNRVCTQQTVGAACTCVVLRGNTSNILQRFVDESERANRYDLRGQLDDSVRSEWLRLGSSVASWCCGDDRLRI